jgi:hypothetical protein
MTTSAMPEDRPAIPSVPCGGWPALTPLVMLMILTALVYLPTGRFDFVDFDDQIYVTQNQQVLRGLSWDTFRWAWTTTHFGFYHPITWLSHLTDVTLFGPNPGAFHLVNALLHLINAALVWRLAWLMTGRWGTAVTVAAVWALHPLRVESVAWIAERKDVLSGFFALLSLISYVHWSRHGRWRDYVLVTLTLGLGLLTKPMLVTLPCVFVLLDRWPPGRQARRVWLEKLPWFAMAMALAAVTFFAKRHTGEAVGLDVLPLSVRLENVVWSYGRYLAMIAYPVGLTVPYPLERHPPVQIVASAMVLAAITGVCLWQRRCRPYLLVGWLWFMGMLFPVSGISQAGQQSHADRFTYLPMIGLLLALAALWRQDAGPWQTRRVSGVVACLVILALAAGSAMQVTHWRDNVTLFEHGLTVIPGNPLAHHQLGMTYAQREQWSPAAEHLLAVTGHLPNDAAVRKQTAEACMRARRWAEARQQLHWLAEHEPPSASVQMNLALVALRMNEPDAAVTHLNRAIAIDPQWREPRELLSKLEPASAR